MATRWAICGTSRIANDFCTTLKSQPESDHKIVAIGSRSLEKAATFAEKFGIPQSFGSYAELASLDNVDVIYVATVASLHVELSLLFINAGKNVLCETPMALSIEGCKKVLSAAREKGVLFLEGVWSVFNPLYADMLKMIQSGEVGDVRMVQVSTGFDLASFEIPRMTQLSLGAGFLIEMGVFLVRAANMFFQDSKPESVFSDFTKNRHGVDAYGVITMRYSNGRYASLTFSDDTQMGNNFLMVRGTKGTLHLPDNFWAPTTLILPDGQVKELTLPPVPEGFTYTYPINSQFFCYEQNAVRDALSKGLKECPQLTFSDMESSFEILQTCMTQNGTKYEGELV